MSQHPSRAEILLAQSRPADAEREARMALGQNPSDPLALTLLARALAGQNREKDALDPARAAIAAAPDSPYAHHVLAHVLLRLDLPKEALASSEAALRLAPDDGDLLAQRAGIRLALRDWRAALEDSEAALRINAEDTFAQNLRATALQRLGRADEAAEAGARTLARAPEDAFSHSTQGWSQLHRGDPRRAQEHFREALRLRPDFEPARHGMLEALKARNPVYRGMLAYFLWMGRQSGRIQWAFLIVTYFGQRIMRNLASSNPALGVVLWPLLVLFYVFVYLSWTAVPLFNLLLRLDRYGRLVLSRKERRDTDWFGASVLLILAAAGWWAFGDARASDLGVIVAAMLSVCVAATVVREKLRNRLIFGGATAALALCAAAGLVLVQSSEGGFALLLLFFFGFFGFQIAANAIKG
jgi:tetratricopeptide (TPR) repeat protein